MSDSASLSFNIDTSNVRKGTGDLDQMKGASDNLARSHDNLSASSTRFLAEAANLIARTSQLRQIYEQTTGSLDAMLSRMDSARQKMNDSSADFSAFATARAQVEALGAAYGQTSTQLEQYNQRATQLGLTTQQTVQSLQRITDAMTAQTEAGRAIRQTYLDLGGSLSALTSGNTGAALQSFIEKIGNVADSVTKFRQVSQVLPGIDPSTYARFNQPNYIPFDTRYERSRDDAVQSANNTLLRDVTQRSRQTDIDNAAFSDLGNKYSYNRVSPQDRARIASYLGSESNFTLEGATTQAGRTSLYQFLDSQLNSNGQFSNVARNALRPDAIPIERPAFIRNVQDGTYDAIRADITQRYREESQHNQLFENPLIESFFPALDGIRALGPSARYVGRNLLNAAGLLERPQVGPNSIQEDFGAQQQRLSSASQAIGGFGFGDGGLGALVSANDQYHNLTTAGVADQFTKALGAQEGSRLYGNILSQLTRQRATAQTPGQAGIDQNAIEGWILSQSRDQQGQARALVQYAQKYAPDVDLTSFARGNFSVQDVLSGRAGGGGSELGAANISSFNRIFSGSQDNRARQFDLDYAQQNERQRGVTLQSANGQASVDQFTVKFDAVTKALAEGASAYEANREATKALSQAQEELASRTNALFHGMDQQSSASYRANLLSSDVGSDPAARAAARAQASLESDAANAVDSGRISPERYRTYLTGQAYQQGRGDLSQSQDTVAGTQHELDNQRQLLSVVNQRADVQAKMARDQAVDNEYAERLGQAQGADAVGGTHFADGIKEAIEQAKTLKDQIAQVNQEASLFKLGNDAAQSASFNSYILSLPPEQQARARALLPAMQQVAQTSLGLGAVGTGIAPGAGAGVISPASRSGLAQAAVAGTPIPAELLAAMVTQESSWSTANSGGLGSILPGTASNPGYGLSPISPQGVADPTQNLHFMAQYLNARGSAMGMTADDWHDPLKVSQALGAYNGGGDPNYVPHVMRYLPPGYFGPNSGINTGAANTAVISGSQAMQAIQNNPALSQYAQGLNSAFNVNLQGRAQQLGYAASAQSAALPNILSLLSSGQTGAAAVAQAGIITDPTDPLAGLMAQQRVRGTTEGQQKDYASTVGSLQQSINSNTQLADVAGQGQAAVDKMNASLQAQSKTLQDNLNPQQAAYLQNLTQVNEQTKEYYSAQQQHANDTDTINAQNFRLGLGIGNQRSIDSQVNTYQATQYAQQHFSDPAQQQQYISDQQTKYNNNQQLNDTQQLQQGVNQAGSALSNSFASAITSGQGLHNVLQSLISDLAQIAIKSVIEKPIQNALGDLVGSAGGSNINAPGGSGLLGGLFGSNGLFGGLFGSSSTPLLTNFATDISTDAAPYLSPGAALAATASAAGNIFYRGRLIPYASGGVIGAPMTWNMASGDVGMAGEAGPEAIMPLRRLPNGNLGVQTSGGGSSGGVMVHAPITINGAQSGPSGLDQKTLGALQKQIEMSARTAVKGVLADERRPGGDLYFNGLN